ncbi:hypothetical protein BGW38_003649, partial [Lunasporangiospora selenospora]
MSSHKHRKLMLDGSSRESPPSPSTLGPSSILQGLSDLADDPITRSTPSSETVVSSDSISLSSLDPLFNPFNSQDHGDWVENDSQTPMTPELKALDVLDTDSVIDANLGLDYDPIQSIGYLGYSPQVSGETRRRSAVSPRKINRTHDILSGSILQRTTLSFAEKLKRKMEDPETLELQSTRQSPDFVESTATVADLFRNRRERDSSPSALRNADQMFVEGSDSGSEAEWDDKVFKKSPLPKGNECTSFGTDESPEWDCYNSQQRAICRVSGVISTFYSKAPLSLFVPTTLTAPLQMTPTFKAKDSSFHPISDDDDIPSLAALSRKIIAPAVLEDSDSDLGDDPFADSFAEASAASLPGSPSPKVPGTLDQEEKAHEASLELGDIDSLDSDPELPEGTGKRTSRRTKSLAADSNLQSTRTLRRSTRQSTVLDVPASEPKPRPVKRQKKPPTFSLDLLLKEKERKDEIGYDLQAVSAQATWTDDLLDEYNIEEEEEVLFGSGVIPKGVLTEEQEGALVEIMQDDQSELVEDVAEFFDLVVPRYVPSEENMDDTVARKVQRFTKSSEQTTMFLASPFMSVMCSSSWTMPRSLFRWLLHVVAAEQNQPVALAAFSLLQKTLAKGVAHAGVSYEDLVEIFGMYGAEERLLEHAWTVPPIVHHAMKSERDLLPESPKFPRQSLKTVIRLVDSTATMNPGFYSPSNVKKIVILFLKMTIDPIIGDVKSALGSVLASLLDTMPSDQWETMRHQLCQDIVLSLGTSLPFILLILNQLPVLSIRTAVLRRSIALKYLQLPPIPEGGIAPQLDDLHRALFVDREFQITPKTDYKRLGRRFQVLGFCLDDEWVIAGYGRKALEPMLRKLRYIHGKIIDVRAAFMERTI